MWQRGSNDSQACINLYEFGCITYFEGHFLCGMSCLSIIVKPLALHAVLFIQQVCTYNFRECCIGNKLPLLAA